MPEPVGATTSALRPAAIDRQAPAWAAVGAAKAASNHARVAGPNPASTPPSSPRLPASVTPSILPRRYDNDDRPKADHVRV